ncbi:MAG TPA: hypothetical protein VEF72_25760 [Mycobacterium sp.]|nr:hypothetical protein [Mycobacterium sp.]
MSTWPSPRLVRRRTGTATSKPSWPAGSSSAAIDSRRSVLEDTEAVAVIADYERRNKSADVAAS